MRNLVAGGAGLIGSHLVDALLDRGESVVVVDNFLTGRRENLAHLADHPRLFLLEADLATVEVREIDSGPFERIFNLASPASPVGYRRYPIETHLVNSIGVHGLLEIARRDGARFIQASTSEVYGDPLAHPQVETYWGNVNPHGPRSCYVEGKRFAESITTEYHRQFGLDTRIARIFNTYGPRSRPDDGRIVPTFCVRALEGKPLTVHGDGSQTRSFCYIDDLVLGLIQLGDSDGLDGAVINLGNPVEISVLSVAELVIELTGADSGIEFGPLPTDDPVRRRPDISLARELLGWTPSIDLRTGLEAMVSWMRDGVTPVAH